MPGQQRNNQEHLEIYLVNLLLAYRPLLFLGGLFLLIYAAASITISIKASIITLVIAILLLLLVYSYQATLYIAKAGAWIGSFWNRNN